MATESLLDKVDALEAKVAEQAKTIAQRDATIAQRDATITELLTEKQQKNSEKHLKLVPIENDFYLSATVVDESANVSNVPITKLRDDREFILQYFEITLDNISQFKSIGIGKSNMVDIFMSRSITKTTNKLKFYYESMKKTEKYYFGPIEVTCDRFTVGCGIVSPPNYLSDQLPFIIFTVNGQPKGKQFILDKNYEDLSPIFSLTSYTVPFKINCGEHAFIFNTKQFLLVEKTIYEVLNKEVIKRKLDEEDDESKGGRKKFKVADAPGFEEGGPSSSFI
uniref:TLDc domain-containing protein n=1 Tax=Meloidogyne hapla TaxID=6305 RepID=A0A1I8BI04_MELHA